MRSALLLTSALVAALAPIARADDPPGLVLAKQVVDEVRGEAHKKKMRIVWPEKVEATPPEGAEVTLITGYIGYEMTRMVWHEGKVDARSVFTNRSWFYNTQGEAFGAAEVDVDPARFAAAWSAARFVIAARDQRIEPEPSDHPNTGGSIGGSHTPHEWVRIRLAGASVPVHARDRQGGPSWNWEHVYDWEGIRDGAVFRLFAPLVEDPSKSRPVAAVTGGPLVTDEIQRAATRLDLGYSGEHHLLLEVCLRVGGEVGDAATRDAVDVLDAALRADERDDWDARTVRANLIGEIETARAKLRLRLDWDAAVARKLLVPARPMTNRESDLQIWTRRRYRETDPAGYLKLLVEQQALGVPPAAGDVARTLDRTRVDGGLDPVALRIWLADDDPDIRVAAARAILAISPDDKEALTLVVATARDSAIRPLVSEHAIHWARVDAITEVGARRLLGSVDLRALLAAEGSQHGLLVQALLDALAASPAPPTAAETLAAWRRVVARPANAGIEVAVTKLLDLKDVESRDAIAAAIERLRQSAAGSYGRADVPVDVAGLKARFAAEMSAPPAPK